MSPTSYRTAPPRTLIVTTAEHRVKPRADPLRRTNRKGVVGFNVITEEPSFHLILVGPLLLLRCLPPLPPAQLQRLRNTFMRSNTDALRKQLWRFRIRSIENAVCF
jgi:hypothetical protein